MPRKLKIKIGSKIEIIDDSGSWAVKNIFEVVVINNDVKLHLIKGDFLEINEFKNNDVYLSLSYLINKDYKILS